MKFKSVSICCAFFLSCFGTIQALFAADSEVGAFRWEKSDTAATLYEGEQVLFSFQYAFADHSPRVPKKDSRRYAGDYLYPFNGLDGENLVDNAPKDHYHHHGVFWTWPGVFIHDEDGGVQTYDLWTSNTNIRQRFVKFHKMEANADSAVITVESGWYVGKGAITMDALLDDSKKGEAIAENSPLYGEKVMTEVVTITTRHPETFEGVLSRSVDVELTLTPTTRPVSLQGAEKKSYGGLTIRFRPKGEIGVDRFITTDEGVAAEDMPEKNLRWADYTSRFGAVDSETGKADALSGAAIFLSPDFPDFPPTWLTRYYGPLCVGFPGVVAQRFEPGHDIVMKARIWEHKGLVPCEILQKAFDAWAASEAKGN